MNRTLLHLRLAEPIRIGALPRQKQKTDHEGRFLLLEVQAGFEPADNGVADRGLTTWLLHQMFNRSNIITNIFVFVKGERE